MRTVASWETSPLAVVPIRDGAPCRTPVRDRALFDPRSDPEHSAGYSAIPIVRALGDTDVLARLLAALRRVVEVSYVASYCCRMPVLNFRTDERSERALAELMADGSSASDAIRQALVDAVRLRRREQMRIESLALMNDEADRAESRKVLSEMDELRAW